MPTIAMHASCWGGAVAEVTRRSGSWPAEERRGRLVCGDTTLVSSKRPLVRPDLPAGSEMTGTTNAAAVLWKIVALDTGSSMLERSMLTYTHGFGEVISVP